MWKLGRGGKDENYQEVLLLGEKSGGSSAKKRMTKALQDGGVYEMTEEDVTDNKAIIRHVK